MRCPFLGGSVCYIPYANKPNQTKQLLSAAWSSPPSTHDLYLADRCIPNGQPIPHTANDSPPPSPLSSIPISSPTDAPRPLKSAHIYKDPSREPHRRNICNPPFLQTKHVLPRPLRPPRQRQRQRLARARERMSLDLRSGNIPSHRPLSSTRALADLVDWDKSTAARCRVNVAGGISVGRRFGNV